MFKIDDITVKKIFHINFEYKGWYGTATVSRFEGSILYSFDKFLIEKNLTENEIQNVKDLILYQLRGDNI